MADVQTYISHLQISIPESIYDTEEKEKKKKHKQTKTYNFFYNFPHPSFWLFADDTLLTKKDTLCCTLPQLPI